MARGLFGALKRAAQYKVTDAADLTWSALLGLASSKAGVAVNIDTALRVSTFFSCLRVLSEGIAQLPLKLLRVGDDGRTRTPATDLTLFDLIASEPNDFQDSFDWRQMMMVHAVAQGNAISYVGRGGKNRDVQEIIPIAAPWRVRQDDRWNLLYYIDGVDDALTPDQIFHLRGPSWNGYAGLDIIHLAREALGLAIATEETHARLFSNGAKPGGVLSVEGTLNKENREALKGRIAEMQEGLHNNYKTMVLDQNAKWQSMAMSGVDAQHIQTRQFQIEEVCRPLRVFPQMVMMSDKTSTFASAEQFFLAHVTHSLMPWIRRWEHGIDRQLVGRPGASPRPPLPAPQAGAGRVRSRFMVEEILRGTPTEQANYFQAALGGARGETAWMTRNEVREIQHLNPVEGGDVIPTPVLPGASPQPPIGGPDKTPSKPAPELVAPVAEQ